MIRNLLCSLALVLCVACGEPKNQNVQHSPCDVAVEQQQGKEEEAKPAAEMPVEEPKKDQAVAPVSLWEDQQPANPEQPKL